ncbi:VOC family protein [Paenibacillus alkalitolerans]|uniref:VOC family protein n=1 Tax=Paenibacillus alkalitolerans TaxID=2799335 RepID=UPI0018F5A965|nr:VOC family protein [Paenibacillus alkalitolerans]
MSETLARNVPAVLFDGGTINVTLEEHEHAIEWCQRVMGMKIAQQENWTPGPEAVVGKMTHMGWGIWIESGKAADGTPAPTASREHAESNIGWYWSARNLRSKYAELQQAGVQLSNIYIDPQGREVFDFRFMNTGTWLTAVEDPAKEDSFSDADTFRIKVKNLSRSIEWYKQYLGMEVLVEHPKEQYCVMTLGINYHPEGRSKWVLEEDPDFIYHGPIDGLFRTRSFVGNREDFFEYHRFLKESGNQVSEMGGFVKQGRVYFHVYDPDGNRFDISHC